MLEQSRDINEEVFLQILDEAVAAVEAEQIPYVLVGGLASAVLGRPRWTYDIDFFIRPEDAPRALKALEPAGFDTEETNPHWIYKGTKKGVTVDLLFKVKGDIYLDDDILGRARTGDFKGRMLRVAPPEDMIVVKALVHDEETPRHWHDALGLIATGDIDWDTLVRRSQFGPRRVLALLLYAQSNDLIVPDEVVAAIYQRLHHGNGIQSAPRDAALRG